MNLQCLHPCKLFDSPETQIFNWNSLTIIEPLLPRYFWGHISLQGVKLRDFLRFANHSGPLMPFLQLYFLEPSMLYKILRTQIFEGNSLTLIDPLVFFGSYEFLRLKINRFFENSLTIPDPWCPFWNYIILRPFSYIT